MSREAATALQRDELLSPLRGLDVFLLAILRADARSYVLPSLRDYRSVQLQETQARNEQAVPSLALRVGVSHYVWDVPYS